MTLKWLLVTLLLQHLGDVAGGQFTAPPPSCPRDRFTFQCTVAGDSIGITIWRVGGSSGTECILLHNNPNVTDTCGPGGVFEARFSTTTATSFTSTLSCGMTPIALDGTLVECFGPALPRDAGNRVGNSTLEIVGPPSVPTLSCVDLSGDINGAVSVTVTWTLSDGDSADFYLINITTNDPQPPYGELLNITTAGVTQCELTGFQAGYEYNTTVHGVNCGSQEGNESEPLTLTPQVPATPASNVCAVYDKVDGALQIIESTWSEVDPVSVSVDCANGQNIRASYELSYTSSSGTNITACVVNGTDCSDGVCHHELQNNNIDNRCQPPVPQFNSESVTVTVTARNKVGRSNPAVSRSVGCTNVILGVSVDTSNPASVLVECTFEPGYTCTIDYGTDPSYTNLVYSDASTTLGQVTTIALSQDLQRETTYYFIVSAESNSQCVRVQGRFRTGCTLTDLTPTDAVRLCADRGFANTLPISNGVVCFSRTAARSEAVYICDDGFHQDGVATRVCQSDGIWNGSRPQCISDANSNITDGGMEALTTGAAVGIAVVTTAVVFFMAGVLTGALVYHCISKHRSQSSDPSLTHPPTNSSRQVHNTRRCLPPVEGRRLN